MDACQVWERSLAAEPVAGRREREQSLAAGQLAVKIRRCLSMRSEICAPAARAVRRFPPRTAAASEPIFSVWPKTMDHVSNKHGQDQGADL